MIVLAKHMPPNERPFVHQFEVKCQSRGSLYQAALSDRWVIADVVEQLLFVLSQESALAAAPVDQAADGAAVDEAGIGT
jgi:hypothetical protein